MQIGIGLICAASALALASTAALASDGHGKGAQSPGHSMHGDEAHHHGDKAHDHDVDHPCPHDHSGLIAAAVAREDRPEAARALDESRKPAETLQWLGIKPGMDVVDISAGRGYWSEIMGHIVGPQGKVNAYTAAQFFGGEEGQARWDALMQRAPAVSLTIYPFEKFSAEAGSFDLAFSNLNYHDLYWESERFNIPRSDPMDSLHALFHAMRPGGIVGIIDHMGPQGDTRAIVEEFHRIAAATVIADFEKAGFELIGQSDLLANPNDDHTLNVFDPAIRGKTDRFMLKFRKPAQ